MIRHLIIPAILLSVALCGCEEDLSSRADPDLPYSIYGVLSPEFQTQSIRLYPLESTITLGSASLDAEVTTTDLQTGAFHRWRDTVLVDDNGQYEYIYWAPFRAEFGHVYRLEAIRRSDGAKSWAEVRIPEMPAFHVKVYEIPVVQLFIEGDDFRVLKPEARYTVNRELGDLPRRTITVSHEAEERRIENGWLVSIDMTKDTDEIVNKYAQSVNARIDKPEHCGALIYLRRLELSVIIGDPVWDPPGGYLEPLILSQPKTMSNVKNGLGFVGGGFRITARAFPPPEAVGSTCLLYGLDPPDEP